LIALWTCSIVLLGDGRIEVTETIYIIFYKRSVVVCSENNKLTNMLTYCGRGLLIQSSEQSDDITPEGN
jgi:hypothetical protein